MFNAATIVRNNNATFYDYGSNTPRPQRFRYLVMVALSMLLSVSIPVVSDNLLAGFLAVQSILLGFTINVMFYLVSNKMESLPDPDILESQLRHERLEKLSLELFYNVSYFNMLSVVSIVIAVFLLMPHPIVPIYLRELPIIESYLAWVGRNAPLLSRTSTIIHFISMSAFYLFGIEVVFTISRIVERTTFFFERKMTNQ